MINYSQIKNKVLRELMSSSASIQSLPEKELKDLVAKIAQLPIKAKKSLIKILQKEQQKLQEIEAKEQAFLEDNLKKIKMIKKGMEKDVRVSHESHERAETQKAAEDLLKNL